jgi:tetratricopeptide (TPR) repeat protein
MKPVAFLEKGEIVMSRSQLGRSMEKISQNADYFFRTANEAAHKGEYLQAVELYDLVLLHDPEYAGAWHEKGNCLDALGRCEEAIASYDEALMNDPCNHETWFRKGLILKRLGREDEAYSCINQGIDPSPGVIGHVRDPPALRPVLLSQLSRFLIMIHLLLTRVINKEFRLLNYIRSLSIET